MKWPGEDVTRTLAASGSHDRVTHRGLGRRGNRVLRGGSWNNNARNTRTANRNRNTPDNRDNNNGFRVVSSGVSTSRVAGIARPSWPEPAGSRIVRACRSAVHRAAPSRRVRHSYPTGPSKGAAVAKWIVRPGGAGRPQGSNVPPGPLSPRPRCHPRAGCHERGLRPPVTRGREPRNSPSPPDRSGHTFKDTGGPKPLPVNPAASVRGPKHVVTVGRTPVLTAEEARQLRDSMDTSTIVGKRDRAMIATMLFTFARIGAVTAMDLEDYEQRGRRMWINLHEKGGRTHAVPAHHTLEEYLDDYVSAAGIGHETKTPLFRSLNRNRQLTTRRIHRREVLAMVKRRARKADLPGTIGCHTMRATGITAYLSNGGLLEHAQRIAAHASSQTTRLYDRRSDAVSLDEVERIQT